MSFRRGILHFARFVAFDILYLGLTDTLAISQVAAGVLVALIATIVLAAFTENKSVHFSIRLSWIKAIVPLPYRVLKGSAVVIATLLTGWRQDRSDGRFYERNPEQSHSPSWRALKTIQVSVAPDSYVVTIDQDSGNMLIHELVGQAAERYDSAQ
jgi:multisubunit Na+/H+ antiporter MnhE subunit